MSMMRRILRHVPGGVVASDMIYYILLDNYCFIREKFRAWGSNPLPFNPGPPVRNFGWGGGGWARHFPRGDYLSQIGTAYFHIFS